MLRQCERIGNCSGQAQPWSRRLSRALGATANISEYRTGGSTQGLSVWPDEVANVRCWSGAGAAVIKFIAALPSIHL